MKRWYFDIERIQQGNHYGCGIACVATVAGVTYARARHEFFPHVKKFKEGKHLAVSGEHMVNALRRLGFEAAIEDDFKKLKVPAIVPFKWVHLSKWSGVHAVVWNPFDRKFVDPGSDHDRGLDNLFYENKWRKSNFSVVAVTGKIAA